MNGGVGEQRRRPRASGRRRYASRSSTTPNTASTWPSWATVRSSASGSPRMPSCTSWCSRIGHSGCCTQPRGVLAVLLMYRGVPIRLQYARDGQWSGEVSVQPGVRLQYKFLLVNESGDVLRWEDGGDRGFCVPDVDVELAEIWRVDAVLLMQARCHRPNMHVVLSTTDAGPARGCDREELSI